MAYDAALKAELAERNAEHSTDYYLQLSEGQLLDLASGYVPAAVKAMALLAIDEQDEDRRRAARPVPRRKEKRP